MSDRPGGRRLIRAIELRGPGLFTVKPATVRVAPGELGIGIRVQREGGAPVPATIAHLAPAPRGLPARITSLATPGGTVMTVEHLLSALAGLAIADAMIEVDGPEIPILEGSASPFAGALLGASEAGAPGPEPIRPARDVTVTRGAASITARPRERGCLYRYELDYGPGSPIPAQSAEWDSGAEGAGARYARDIAPARTFSLEREAQAMRAAGLFIHLSPRDVLVFGEQGPIDNDLRFPNEPARHKLLDLIGDLALLGRPLAAEVTATRSGHALTHELVRAILAAQ